MRLPGDAGRIPEILTMDAVGAAAESHRRENGLAKTGSRRFHISLKIC
jgi:hypothetical protein